MTVQTDEIIGKVVDLQASFRALNDLDDSERIQAALELASAFLEFAAFEMATVETPQKVSEAILLAAKLDVLAQEVIAEPQAFADAHSLRE